MQRRRDLVAQNPGYKSEPGDLFEERSPGFGRFESLGLEVYALLLVTSATTTARRPSAFRAGRDRVGGVGDR